MSGSSILWNDQIKLILSDVDETIADVYKPAEPEMIAELSSFLRSGGKLFMVTGGSLARVQADIISRLDLSLRRHILISHCSGAEVWGFTEDGNLRDNPFYSIYEESFTPELRQLWRDKVQELMTEFGFRPHPARPIAEFRQQYSDPLDIVYDDRGPQITLELVNAYNLSNEQAATMPCDVPVTYGNRDLRIPVLKRAEQLFLEAGVPIKPHLGGNFALDLAITGVSKTTSIQRILSDSDVLATIGLTLSDVQDVIALEIWGDKFSTIRGGTDRFMSAALPPQVRSIDFRSEDPAEFQEGYNIVVWDGEHQLQHGLLEYLQARST